MSDYIVKVYYKDFTIDFFKKGLEKLETTIESGSSLFEQLLFILDGVDLDGRFSWNDLVQYDKTGTAQKILDAYTETYFKEA
jgi:hypothetical protein